MADLGIDVKSALLAGLTGTTAMTAFSYLVSEKKGKYFKEPEILNDLIDRLINTKAEEERRHVPGVTGFMLHYGTGITFSVCNHLFWKRKHRIPGVAAHGLGFGLLFGLIGIGIWKAVFTLHPYPPRIHLNDFLGHLLVAHVIFGETVSFTRTLLPTERAGTSAAEAGTFRVPGVQRNGAGERVQSVIVNQGAAGAREF